MNLLPGMKKPKAENVEITTIRTDLGTQSRTKLDPETVQIYAAAMRKNADFPRILLFRDKAVEGYILIDGRHRLEAHRLVRPDWPIAAEVVNGTLEKARWFSYGMNATHGLKRCNADKNRAVRLALQHKMGVDKSNCEVADHVGVDEKLVRRVREELESTSALPKTAKRVGRDGRTINTEKIGKPKKTSAKNEAKNTPVPEPTSPIPPAEKIHSGKPAPQESLTDRQLQLRSLYPEPDADEVTKDIVSAFPKSNVFLRRLPFALFADVMKNPTMKYEAENVLVNFIRTQFFKADAETQDDVLRTIHLEILDGDHDGVDKVFELIAQEKKRLELEYPAAVD